MKKKSKQVAHSGHLSRKEDLFYGWTLAYSNNAPSLLLLISYIHVKWRCYLIYNGSRLFPVPRRYVGLHWKALRIIFNIPGILSQAVPLLIILGDYVAPNSDVPCGARVATTALQLVLQQFFCSPSASFHLFQLSFWSSNASIRVVLLPFFSFLVWISCCIHMLQSLEHLCRRAPCYRPACCRFRVEDAALHSPGCSIKLIVDSTGREEVVMVPANEEGGHASIR